MIILLRRRDEMNATNTKQDLADGGGQSDGARRAARDARRASAIEAAYLLELSQPARLTNRAQGTFRP
jgi:hypothetical protein